MVPWLKIDSGKYAIVKADPKHPHFQRVTSPFNLPQAIKSYVDDTKNRLAIEFQYFDDEAPLSRQLRLGGYEVTLFTTENGALLRRIEVPLDQVGGDETQRQKSLEEIAALVKGAKQDIPDGNIVGEVLSDHAGRLTEESLLNFHNAAEKSPEIEAAV